MSLFNYRESTTIDYKDYPFHALIMAAMRKADKGNFAKLLAAFPEIYTELEARYNAPGGRLEGDPLNDEERTR